MSGNVSRTESLINFRYPSFVKRNRNYILVLIGLVSLYVILTKYGYTPIQTYVFVAAVLFVLIDFLIVSWVRYRNPREFFVSDSRLTVKWKHYAEEYFLTTVKIKRGVSTFLIRGASEVVVGDRSFVVFDDLLGYPAFVRFLDRSQDIACTSVSGTTK